ncbi:GNAT family N-acetyltransferase [Paenibacillus sp. 32352]|uniref:GNAT family N-acetyltransferase n=1 Tax=Paenibacillus sp. 32352 TaxID=1969111 RepID=UPI0009AC003C|nr:GNAT family N-acetyltransferase [Paenibacillus sp. 32352]
MKIVEATKDNLTEIMLFYNEMCEVLGQKSFLPDGNKGGFPSQAMVEAAIKEGCQFIGIEDKKIVAAYILSHDCDDAYQSVHWHINASKDEVMIIHALRVLPEYGGRGYSKRLVEHAIKTAKDKKQKAIRLDCLKGNDIPAKMYMSYGFEYVDTVDITYIDIGIPRKFQLYELVL